MYINVKRNTFVLFLQLKVRYREWKEKHQCQMLEIQNTNTFPRIYSKNTYVTVVPNFKADRCIVKNIVLNCMYGK
jgi:hypothetical protein